MLPFQLNSKISLRSALSGMALIGSLIVALIAAGIVSDATSNAGAFDGEYADRDRRFRCATTRREPCVCFGTAAAWYSDIWRMDLSTNTSVSITVDEAQDTQPRWSRDGRYLAFRSQWSDHHSSIRVYDTATEHSMKLIQVTTRTILIGSPIARA